MIPPPRQVGDSLWADAWNKTIEAQRALQPAGAPDTLVSHSPHGVIREIEDALPPYATDDAATAIFMMRVKQVLADTLVCRLWTGSGETGGDISVCKPSKLRHRANETIEGALFTYTYAQNATYPTIWVRTVVDSRGGGESQVIVPRYLANDIIYVAKCTTEVAAADYIDLNVDGRLWARSYLSPLGEVTGG